MRPRPAFLPEVDFRPQVGEQVLVVGSPLGLEQSVSEVLVSAFRTRLNRGTALEKALDSKKSCSERQETHKFWDGLLPVNK